MAGFVETFYLCGYKCGGVGFLSHKDSGPFQGSKRKRRLVGVSWGPRVVGD